MANFDDLFSGTKQEKKKTETPAFDKEAWAEKKQQERNEVYAMLDEAIGELTSDGECFKDYLNVQSIFNRYSVSNALLITYQNNEATRLADFDTWKESGVSVQKGETSIRILEPGKEYTRDDGTTGVSMNVKHMFDISQTDAEPRRRQPMQYDERKLLKALIQTSPCDIVGTDTLPQNINAAYIPGKNIIQIRKGMSAQEIFSNLSDCIAGAKAEQKNIAVDERSFTSRCVSYIVSGKFGMDVGDYSFDDVKSVFAGKEPKQIRETLEKVRDTANEIGLAMEKALDEKNKSDRSEAR